MSGPRPLPTTLRAISGNASHRPLNDSEPTPKLRIPDPPNDMSQEALPYWREYAEQLLEMRVLTEVDQMALAMVSEYTYDYWRLGKKVRTEGIVVKIGKSKYPQYNPHWTAQCKVADKIKSLLQEFGLTPSSRTRVRVE
jgi:P27 family predicted phage terminase small subunit